MNLALNNNPIAPLFAKNIICVTADSRSSTRTKHNYLQNTTSRDKKANHPQKTLACGRSDDTLALGRTFKSNEDTC